MMGMRISSFSEAFNIRGDQQTPKSTMAFNLKFDLVSGLGDKHGEIVDDHDQMALLEDRNIISSLPKRRIWESKAINRRTWRRGMNKQHILCHLVQGSPILRRRTHPWERTVAFWSLPAAVYASFHHSSQERHEILTEDAQRETDKSQRYSIIDMQCA